MHSKNFTLLMMVLSLGFSAAQVKGSTIVEFSEVSLTSPTLLDGTNYFEPYGLSFEDTTYWGTISRFIGAGLDDVGIGPGIAEDNIMTVIFSEDASWVNLYWLTTTYHTITATAFDPSGNPLDTQTGSGPFDTNYGNFIFSDIGTISKITMGDEYTGVGRIEFVPIPEPASFTLLGVGVIFTKYRKG